MNTKKNSAKLIITVALCFILCITASFVVIKNTDKTDLSGASVYVIDSGITDSSSDDFYGKIISADIDSENPYIEVEWFNNSGTSYTAVDEFYIYKTVNGKTVDCRKNPDSYAWPDIAYVFSSYGCIRMKYFVGDMDIETGGTYLLRTDIYPVNADSLKSTLWLEFRTGEADAQTAVIN